MNAYMSVGGNDGNFHRVPGMVEGRMSVRLPERGVLVRGCLFSIFLCLEKFQYLWFSYVLLIISACVFTSVANKSFTYVILHRGYYVFGVR